jgi:hypothetical protein
MNKNNLPEVAAAIKRNSKHVALDQDLFTMKMKVHIYKSLDADRGCHPLPCTPKAKGINRNSLGTHRHLTPFVPSPEKRRGETSLIKVAYAADPGIPLYISSHPRSE